MVVARVKGTRIWVVDVQLAYLQSDKSLMRKIFITNPAPELELSHGECLEHLKSIYDYADSGDEWHRTLAYHVQIDLEMFHTIVDPSLYCQFEDDKLVGVNGSYVDDLL